MDVFSALGCAIITFVMSLLHILLLLGMPLGEYVLGGKDMFLPKEKMPISIIFAAIFILIGLVYLARVSVIKIPIPNLVSKIIMITYTVFLAYAIIGNIFFTNSIKEQVVMIPCSAIAFVLSLATLITTWNNFQD